jgi:flagellar basal body-associated protein FliL
MKKLQVMIFIVVLAVLFIPAAHGLSASIGNAKAILRVNASPEDPAILERTILVNNKNDIPVKINIKPNVEFAKFVNIIDKDFVLQPGESKKAEFILTIDRGGTLQGNILVSFAPEDPESKQTPVGLSSTLIIISEGPMIEEPEEEVVEETPNLNDAQPEDEARAEAVKEETVEEAPEDETAVPVPQKTESNRESKEQASPSPLVGVLITLLIVGIGAIIFFIVLKSKKTK